MSALLLMPWSCTLDLSSSSYLTSIKYLVSMIEAHLLGVKSIVKNDQFALQELDRFEGPTCEKKSGLLSPHSNRHHTIFVLHGFKYSA